MSDGSSGPRRAPAQRQRDAARTKQRLLEAAREVFAVKGFDGARVQEIANRAGVDKQLISYYFGGKNGLHAAIWRDWQEHEAAFARTESSLSDTVAHYLSEVLTDPRLTRLLIWHSLETVDDDGAVPSESPGPSAELDTMQTRREHGELADDLDDAAVVLALTGAVTVAATMPHVVQRLFGFGPEDPEFARRYTDQLRRIAARMALPLPPGYALADPASPTAGPAAADR
ncbi:TetR family transcriptional regulator [Nocardia tengchongensis]|uniref:TetR family transcriptional regulator n=1 Tax=Nocardia tengchongensis TaxID=2055889 RepID=UPI0036A33512